MKLRVFLIGTDWSTEKDLGQIEVATLVDDEALLTAIRQLDIARFVAGFNDIRHFDIERDLLGRKVAVTWNSPLHLQLERIPGAEPAGEFAECRRCDWLVVPSDQHCPHCGIFLPHPKRCRQRADQILLAFTTVTMAPLLLAFGGTGYLIWIAVWIAACYGICALADEQAFGLLAGKVVGRLFDRRPSSHSITGMIGSIHRKLAELDERGSSARLLLERSRAENQPDSLTAESLRVLEEAEGAIDRMRREYLCRLWQVRLLAVRNQALGTVRSIYAAGGGDQAACIRRIDRLIADATELRQQWEGEPLLASTPEGRQCIERLGEIVGMLKANQVVIVVKGVSPIQDGLVPAPLLAAGDGGPPLEGKTNAELAETLRQLDEEFKRLQIERKLVDDTRRALS